MIRDQANGFTLIELVVTLTLLGIIAGFVGAPLITMIEARQDINEKVAQDADAVFALGKISNEIRFGGISSGCSEGSDAVTTNTSSSPKYKLTNDNNLIEENNDSVIVTDVVNFSCDPLGSGLDLYELTLELKSRTYTTRAYHRN